MKKQKTLTTLVLAWAILVCSWVGTGSPFGTNQAFASTLEKVALSGRTAYLANGSNGLRILDVTTPSSPAEVGRATTWGYAMDLDVSGSTLAVAENDYGLELFNIDAAHSPKRTGGIGLPGNAVAVTINGRYAYVAAMGSGLLVVDISNPWQPRLVRHVEMPGYAMDIALNGSAIFVANGFYGVRTYSLGDPANPGQISLVNTPGYAESIMIQNNHAYVAVNKHGMSVINMQNPWQPQYRTTISAGGSISGVSASGSNLYALDDIGTLRVYSTNAPANPVQMGTFGEMGAVSDIFAFGNTAYATSQAGAFSVLDVSSGIPRTLANMTIDRNTDSGDSGGDSGGSGDGSDGSAPDFTEIAGSTRIHWNDINFDAKLAEATPEQLAQYETSLKPANISWIEASGAMVLDLRLLTLPEDQIYNISAATELPVDGSTLSDTELEVIYNATTIGSAYSAVIAGYTNFVPRSFVPLARPAVFQVELYNTASANQILPMAKPLASIPNIEGLRANALTCVALRPDGEAVQFAGYMQDAGDTTDGTWALEDAEGNFLAADTAVDPAATYRLRLNVADGGSYDADSGEGYVEVSAVMGVAQVDGVPGESTNGGGGCSLSDASGPGLEWLLLLLPLALRLRRSN